MMKSLGGFDVSMIAMAKIFGSATYKGGNLAVEQYVTFFFH